jgi:hypothetical protein
VLVVDGDPSVEPLKGEVDFLRIALQPFREGGAKNLVDLLQTKVINLDEFNAAKIGEARVVILANVAKLKLKQLNELQDFVKDGGGLLIFGGDQVDQKWYNDFLLQYGLLPARLGEMADKRKDPEPFSRIIVQRFDNPALEIFSNPRNGDLASAEINRWHRTLENPDNDLVRPLARLETGDALLLEKKWGNGRIIFCATTCDDAWSSLPLREVFVPFVQRLSTYLASSVMPPRNLGVGEKAVAHFPASAAGGEVVVLDSQEKEHTISIEARGGRGVATFDDTSRPGLYEMKGPDGKPIHFVVNTERSESDLKQLAPEKRREVSSKVATPRPPRASIEIVCSFSCESSTTTSPPAADAGKCATAFSPTPRFRGGITEEARYVLNRWTNGTKTSRRGKLLHASSHVVAQKIIRPFPHFFSSRRASPVSNRANGRTRSLSGFSRVRCHRLISADAKSPLRGLLNISNAGLSKRWTMIRENGSGSFRLSAISPKRAGKRPYCKRKSLYHF